MYLLIALSSKCSLNARIKDYVQLILQLNISNLVNISRYIITLSLLHYYSNHDDENDDEEGYYHLRRNHSLDSPIHLHHLLLPQLLFPLPLHLLGFFPLELSSGELPVPQLVSKQRD